MFDDVEVIYDSSNKRRSFRVYLGKNNWFKLKVSKYYYSTFFSVRDLSGTGVSFWIEKSIVFKEGDVFNLHFFVKDKPLFKVKGKVVRVSKEHVACEFVEMNRQLQFQVDKLVLELQKQMIAKKKLEQRNAKQDEPKT